MSTLGTRWVAPALVILVAVAFSVYTALFLPGWRLGDTREVALFGIPAIAPLVLLALRLIAGPTGRHGDLVITWLMSFLTAMHALLLAFGLGIVRDLLAWAPAVTGLSFLGLGLTMSALEAGSAMGVRTKATLSGEGPWRRAHRRLGLGLGASGLAGAGAAFTLGRPAILVLVAGASASLLAALLTRPRADEEAAADPRPTDAP